MLLKKVGSGYALSEASTDHDKTIFAHLTGGKPVLFIKDVIGIAWLLEAHGVERPKFEKGS